MRLRRVKAALKSTIEATKRVFRLGILPTHDVIGKLVIRYEHCYPFISVVIPLRVERFHLFRRLILSLNL
jgi:hypothetical protein